MTPPAFDVVVIGASFAGLFAAAAAQHAGHGVLLVERDELGDDAVERPGVPQGAQPHILLHRGLVAIEGLLPGLRDELVAAGGIVINTGDLAWLSPDGWLPTGVPIYEIVSLSRPLLELAVRRRVRALPGVQFRTETRVTGIRRDDDGWLVSCTSGRASSDPQHAAHSADHAEDGSQRAAGNDRNIDGNIETDGSEEARRTDLPDQVIGARIVIDASGRSSRLPHWLAELGLQVPEPIVVEARLGYATRRYRSPAEHVLDTGVVIAATPETEAGALALPVEHGEWLVGAGGFGERRLGRDPDDFERYLRDLPDPALADLTARLEPIGDVRIYRQTGNRRHRYARADNWPAGLLVVGDALTVFNPVYGQGITVAACQAELLARALAQPLDARASARLQRQLAKVADLAWSIATGEDVRFPSCSQHQTPAQRLTHRWSQRVNQLGAAGDTYCHFTLGSIYHMMAPAIRLFGPRIVRSVLRSLVTGVPPAAARPAVLDAVRPASR